MGIPHLVVAVNKMDLVDFDQGVFAAIVADFTAFAQASGIRDARFVPLSALDGDMVVDRGSRLPWYTGPTLLQILETVDSAPTLARGPLRFPVQFVARPAAGQPRGYMGRIESGSIAVGDIVTALPSLQSARVRAIRTYEGDRRHAGTCAASNRHRGQPASCRHRCRTCDEVGTGQRDRHRDATNRLSRRDRCQCWRPQGDREDLPARRAAKVERIDYLWNVSTQSRESAPAALAMNDIGHVRLALAQPAFVDRYGDSRATGSFILIDEATHDTVAAGMVQ